MPADANVDANANTNANDSPPNILIVGAGPVGLVTAIALARKGIKATIVDALPRGHNGARASGIHAHTLEQLHTLDLANGIVSRGIKALGLLLFDGHGGCTASSPLVTLRISRYLDGKTAFPYVVLTPQCVLEGYLEDELERCGGVVRRGMRVVGMRPGGVEMRAYDDDDDGEESDRDGGADSERPDELGGGAIKVSFDDGSSIDADYVIGADGSKSVIRECAGIPFVDPLTDDTTSLAGREEKRSTYIVLADITLEGPTPPTFLRDHLSPHVVPGRGFMMVIPLPPFPECSSGDDAGNGSSVQADAPSTSAQIQIQTHWRVGFFRFSSKRDQDTVVIDSLPPANPDLAYIQRCFDDASEHWNWMDVGSPKVARLHSSSRYRTREAIAETMYKRLGGGHVVLVGDAAHVHSPVGGQGMNLGICDAISLSKALAAHLDRSQLRPRSTCDSTTNDRRDRDRVSHHLESYSTKRLAAAARVVSFSVLGLRIIRAAIVAPAFVRRAVGVVLGWTRVFWERGVVWRMAGMESREYD